MLDALRQRLDAAARESGRTLARCSTLALAARPDDRWAAENAMGVFAQHTYYHGEAKGLQKAIDCLQADANARGPSPADRHGLLHRLWSKAVGTPSYIKAEWKALAAFVEGA